MATWNLLHLMGALLLAAACIVPLTSCTAGSQGMQDLFSSLDKNGDGEINQQEAINYIANSIGGAEFDSDQEIKDAAASMLHTVDGQDAGATISLGELESHLHNVLKGVRVHEWVAHGLGLPQYANSFKDNSVSPSDFPALLKKPALLETELGVHSVLHRGKLHRAIQAQLLGLGAAPSSPQALRCSCQNSGRENSTLLLEWDAPVFAGKPGFHKYVVERLDTHSRTSRWLELGESEDVTQMADTLRHTAVSYRVVAWSWYGRSPYASVKCPAQDELCRCPSGSCVNAGASTATPASHGTTSTWAWAHLNSLALLLAPIALRFLVHPRLLEALHKALVAVGFLPPGPEPRPQQPHVASIQRMSMQQPSAGNGMGIQDPTNSTHPTGACGSFSMPNLNSLPRRSMSSQAEMMHKEASLSDMLSRQLHQQELHKAHSNGELLSAPNSQRRLAVPTAPSTGPIGIAERLMSSHHRSTSCGQDLAGSPPLPPGPLSANSAYGKPAKKMCAYAGCLRKIDMMHYKEYKQKHYCGRCQQSYCLEHTAYSSHGPTGSCGQESKCVCVSCFATFNAEYQLYLIQRNTLGERKPVDSPVQRVMSRLRSLEKRPSSPGSSSMDSMPLMDLDEGRVRWHRAWTKVKAVVRFSHAGEQRRRLMQSGSGTVQEGLPGQLQPLKE